MIRTLAALLAFLLIVGACSSKPVSQAAEETPVSATDAPATAAVPSAAATTSPTDAPAAPTATPDAQPTPTPGIPPKPGSPTWTLEKQTRVKATGRIIETYRVTWTAPTGVADEFLVYGVKGCLRESKKHDGKPCVVKGMPIPKSRLVKLGSAPGDAREMKVTYEVDEVGPGTYGTILIRAANAAGRSIFTIVHSDDVCWRCTY
jgi:hypothetical protein